MIPAYNYFNVNCILRHRFLSIVHSSSTHIILYTVCENNMLAQPRFHIVVFQMTFYDFSVDIYFVKVKMAELIVVRKKPLNERPIANSSMMYSK